MDLVFFFFAPVLGVFVGTLLVSRIGIWVAALVETVREAQGPSAWSVLTILVFHSAPWLLGLTVYWAWYTLSAPHSPAWPWFFGGICAAPLLWAPVFLLEIRRAKRIEAERKEPDHAP